MYSVQTAPRAARFFQEADPALQRKLDRCIEQLKADPRRHPNIKPLKGTLSGYWRFRAGDYRIVYWIDDRNGIVYVDKIAHRSQVYG